MYRSAGAWPHSWLVSDPYALRIRIALYRGYNLLIPLSKSIQILILRELVVI
jgi:hypothetical protein